jgi:hypothetical protein
MAPTVLVPYWMTDEWHQADRAYSEALLELTTTAERVTGENPHPRETRAWHEFESDGMRAAQNRLRAAAARLTEIAQE